ncbi:hypothetical protein [Chitinophaga caseinilytica]|uniref:hypothetical protein n=1 Tax=Chitinophaga caseinilytica TaxID=2267521 RepID=UPI003C2EE248
MNAEQFVAIVKMVVGRPAAIESTSELDYISKHNPDMEKAAVFYNGLGENEKAFVKDIVQEAVHSTLFGFFCVLDGVRAIEGGSEKGRLELWYKNDHNGKSVLLNDGDNEFLHDLFND